MDTTQQPLDTQAVNLAKAIRQTESGGNFQAEGKSGEYGAYQFTEPTWNTASEKYLGQQVPLKEATREQQNEVAYKQIKEWKDAGYNVGQVASMWNAGESNPNAYLDGNSGTNKYGVHYDTAAYAKSVASAYQTLKHGGQVTQADPNNPSSTAGVGSQRSNIESQGQPVSVNPEKTKPTFLGGLIRGALTLPARLGTNIAEAAETLGGVPQDQLKSPFSGKYLGDVKPIGVEDGGGLSGKNLKESLGAGLEAGSYLIGGGEAKAGLEAAQAGKLFTKGLLKTAGKGALEGAGIGALGGAGGELQKPNSTLGSVVTQGLVGGGLGAVTGGLLGAVGGSIAKAKGITPETIDAVKNTVGKDYLDSLGSSVAGRKVLAENSGGMQASIEAGILPDIENGRYNTTEATAKLQEMMDKLGQARGADISAHDQPVDVNILKQKISDNISQFVKDPLEQKKVSNTVQDWFDALGNKKLTLEKLNELQVAVGKKAKFANESDAVIRNAYRNIYHGIGNFINDAVGGSGGVNKEVNDTLTKYHGIMDFLDAIHEKPVKNSGLAGILASHAAKTTATGLGAAVGGAPGAIIANETMPILERMVRKILGADNSSYSKVMDAIRSGEQSKIDLILKQVEKNKGTQVVRDIQRSLEEVKQLPASTLPKGKTAEIYSPIKLGGETTYEKPAEKITKQSFNPKNKKYYTKGLLGGGNS